MTDQIKELSVPLPELVEAVFVERKNRFVGMVEVAGQINAAHVPSSGRMWELLFPGNIVYVAPSSPGKRTQYRIYLASFDKTLVSVDSLLPNRLIYKVLSHQALAFFKDYREIKKEVTYGESRFDLCLKGGSGIRFIEVKSITLVEEGTAKFPDAPSERGEKHLKELTRAVVKGNRASVIFVIQRNDARVFSPNLATDPTFTQALCKAVSAGVEVYALACDVNRKAVSLGRMVPVRL